MDEGYSYTDNYPSNRYVSPTTIQSRTNSFPPLSTRAQIINNEMNHQESPVPNNMDNSFNGRTKFVNLFSK